MSGEPTSPRKGSAFWLSFLAIVVCTLVSALDATAIATALPTITNDLHGGDDFVWVGSAYTLASTAVLLLSGRLADTFGRRPVMLGAVLFFALGSALAGAAQNMNMLIAARTVQGVGGGAMLTLSEIITADLVPLSERGTYQGIISLTWAFASGIGPPIGGALAQKATWRWIFYLNLPIIGVAFALVLIFLRVRTPPGSAKEKLARVDWVGNGIIMAGTTVALIGLTWGEVRYSWSDAHVLAPLILGLAVISAFFAYEWNVPNEPTIPWEVVANRTTLVAFVGTFWQGIVSTLLFLYLPVYFQAVKDASPLKSSVDILATSLIVSPFAFLCGVLVQRFQRYLPLNYIAWMLVMIGFGLFSTLDADSSTGRWVGFQIITAAGIGTLFTATVFPVLAPLPVSRAAAALAFYAFARTFAQTWGITLGGTILQNRLHATLPLDFSAAFPQGTEIAYAAIPLIRGLPEPLRGEVRAAFAKSMATVWWTAVGMGGLGLLSVLGMREVRMGTVTDERYGLENGANGRAEGDVETDPAKGEGMHAVEPTTGTEAETKGANAVVAAGKS